MNEEHQRSKCDSLWFHLMVFGGFDLNRTRMETMNEKAMEKGIKKESICVVAWMEGGRTKGSAPKEQSSSVTWH